MLWQFPGFVIELLLEILSDRLDIRPVESENHLQCYCYYEAFEFLLSDVPVGSWQIPEFCQEIRIYNTLTHLLQMHV